MRVRHLRLPPIAHQPAIPCVFVPSPLSRRGLPKRADAGDALRTGGTRTIQVVRADAAERIHRQARVLDELRETIPTQRRRAGMRCGDVYG